MRTEFKSAILIFATAIGCAVGVRLYNAHNTPLPEYVQAPSQEEAPLSTDAAAAVAGAAAAAIEAAAKASVTSTYPEVQRLIDVSVARCSISELEQIKRTAEIMIRRGTVVVSDLYGFPECMTSVQ